MGTSKIKLNLFVLACVRSWGIAIFWCITYTQEEHTDQGIISY